MAVFPSDDLALAIATRKRLRPLIDAHASGPSIENVKRNAVTQGKSQSRDVWGRKKFMAVLAFDRLIDDIELLHSFTEVFGVSGFTYFDFEQKQVGLPGYRPAVSIGTGDGVTATFTLPAREIVSSTLIVYVSAVQKTAGVDYNLAARSGALNDGPGPVGEDQVVFIAGHIPAAAAPITAAFKGRYRYTAEIPEPAKKHHLDWNRQLLEMTVLEKF